MIHISIVWNVWDDTYEKMDDHLVHLHEIKFKGRNVQRKIRALVQKQMPEVELKNIHVMQSAQGARP